ncbi:amino acid permease NDAI_0F04390 [Naumovozyma dairenensis CBS 421]|uniref:Amino acid permease/ SLC12A domain-containing protein n=1 Tax=Naumovozyma dairenensis (strain ATCC 10597 / BCRC 20456 / CBS 421 / NBRC 0211 / NRRL Y-12639) TaxID=1071378 RepID=G0WD96_NAUDC|nr:hypothetical protein NDAI_0F04390 [Naumovozyma dairenensis CBS 421]CCD25757.1 hypothetical protein NDAI_0F04390 [Naumovozyma dairenensis CBS 421]
MKNPLRNSFHKRNSSNNNNSTNGESSSVHSDNVTRYEMKNLKPKEKEISTEQENEVEYFENTKIQEGGIDDSTITQTNDYEQNITKPTSRVRNFIDSFKPAEVKNSPEKDTASITSNEMMIDEEILSLSNLDGQRVPPPRKIENKSDELKKTIKPRHVLMISLGTGIGTGLLVGLGSSLVAAGPAGLLLGFGIMGTCLYCIIQAVGEMAVAYSDLVGGFNAYPSFLVDPAFGFSVAWVYALQWLCVCPLELVTASMTIKYWTTKVDPDVFVIIFYVLILAINIVGGAAGYAEAEFIFNSCKILMMIGFFILGIIIICGGAGNDGYIGGKYWHEPGAFRGEHAIDRFKGVMATLVNAAFAFGMSEFIGVTASEQSNPRKAIPSAAKKMLYRIVCMFLASITIVGFLVPYDSDQLLGSSGGGVKASPYVLAVSTHGVKVVPHFINAVILISVLSVANSAFYSSSRMLLSLAEQGYAPKIFCYIDREGRPLVGMAMASLFGVIAFCATSPKEDEVFVWLLAISGLSQLFTWIAICVSHVRFRRAMHVQGKSIGELGFRSQVGAWGSSYAAIMMVCILIAQFWVAIAPIGEGKLDAKNFFENYLAMPILLALYFGYKIYTKNWTIFIRAKDIDLVSHRNIFDEEIIKQEEEEYREKLRNGPMWRRVYDFWC